MLLPKKSGWGGPTLLDVQHRLGIVGHADLLQDSVRRAAKYAATRRPVLISGETGVGKESLAMLIHHLSPLQKEMYVCVNCATLTDELAMSHLFGHEKGSFTGAVERHDGIFSRADGGTIFLDEVAELSLKVQAMLLRVLQTGEFSRLGGTTVLTTKVRIIAATNRKLSRMVTAGTFREDLFYRLSVLRVSLPPLRDRLTDLRELVAHRVDVLNAEEGLSRSYPEAKALQALMAYRFPGNIRGLFSLVDRVYFDGHDGPLCFTEELSLLAENRLDGVPSLKLVDVEREHIRRVLALCGGKVGGPGGAAELLGMPRTTLLSLMGRLGLR